MVLVCTNCVVDCIGYVSLMYLMGMEFSFSETFLSDEERIKLIKKNQEKRLQVAWPVFVSNLQSLMTHASRSKKESIRGRIKNGKQVLENAAKRVTTSRPRKEKAVSMVGFASVVSPVGRRCYEGFESSQGDNCLRDEKDGSIEWACRIGVL